MLKFIRNLSPAALLTYSYLLGILIGTILLSLPAAATEEPLSLIDALFTATSALCVTGLAVVDTGGDFSRFGQAIILTLIQIGGLGIMTFGVVLAVATGWRVSTRQRVLIQELYSAVFLKDVKGIFKLIVLFALIAELAVMILLIRDAKSLVPQSADMQAMAIMVFFSVAAVKGFYYLLIEMGYSGSPA